MEYRYQVASDVLRDGLGVELTAADGNVIAEVFRCDADNSLTVTLYVEAVPFAHIEKLIGMVRRNLGGFEDGTNLPPPIA
ncbi:MAG: hypothetical protein V4631_21410 [Pseudomonadota bacterium]